MVAEAQKAKHNQAQRNSKAQLSNAVSTRLF
jgi:hypothetical protein